MKARLALLLAASLAGCAFGGSSRGRAPKHRLTEAERLAAESQALSSLAALEAAVAGFAKTKGAPPRRLEDVVPLYLPEMPVLDLGLEAHPLTRESSLFPAEILQDGAPDPARLRDSGRWGYIAGAAPLVFIDCTHQSSRLRPWHLERGVF